MVHLGKNTRSKIISKGISAGHGNNTYRGLVKVMPRAADARNFTQCDSLLIGDQCGAHTTPYVEVQNSTAHLEHEAFTSKVSEEQLFYCQQRGMSAEDANSSSSTASAKRLPTQLPFEFAIEATRLLELSLEGSVG